MPNVATKDIRNIAFLGHGNAGKTTLADAILFKAKASTRQGSIDDGSSVFDFDPEEKERKISIDLTMAAAMWGGKEVMLLDAPGYSDFSGEAVSAVAAADTAVIFINASAGIMVNTRKMWALAQQAGVAMAVMISKMDQENINYSSLLQSIQENFGSNCIPVLLPSGSGAGFSQGVKILGETPSVPAGVQEIYNQAKEKLMEMDDALLEKYLEGKEVTAAELEKAIPKAVYDRKLVPVFCSSVRKDVGVTEFLDFAARYFPSPADRPVRPAAEPEKNEPVEVHPDPNEPFRGQVFKSYSDPFVGKVSYIRIFSGTMSSDVQLFNQRAGKAERMGNFFKPFGKDQRNITKAVAGEIVGATKVDSLQVSDTVCDPNHQVKFSEIVFPIPMVSLAIEPKTKGDEQRLSISLHKMAESDPTFKTVRDRQTNELVISGLSQLHLDITLARLKRKYEVQLNTKSPKIPYKETILGKAQSQYKHKKQSGGHGQYGEVYINLEPTARGEGFKFVDAITQGRIPNQYIPAVEKGIRELLEKGVVAGYPIVDVQVTLFDGSYHDVDSSEASFKIAASKAFQMGFKNARPALLEPIVNLEVVVPSAHMGNITGDLNSRRGRIMGMDTQGNLQVIRAQIPLAEVSNYSTELRSTTGGEGSYSIEFSHYDVVPQKLMEAIVAKSKKAEEKEEE